VNKELELWQFVAQRLARNEPVMLLVVAESSGSSPGRRGYKIAVGADGELIGSIGGGVMEVKLVEESRGLLHDAVKGGRGDTQTFRVIQQEHRKNSPNASGMICSGKQTVIFTLLTGDDSPTVDEIVDALTTGRRDVLQITSSGLNVLPPEGGTQNELEMPPGVSRSADPNSRIQNPKLKDYTETLGLENDLYIIGGGHCALALSELMSKMDFHISLFDDRPELNTIAKNRYAHITKIVDSYDRIGDYVFSGQRAYVVVMTLGYKTDELVIRSLIDGEFKYFGVLGSKAKMATMLAELRRDGIPGDKLDRIRTPIGLPIHSRTPDEIAVSIAAEIIAVKNG
jgi:xanthine dehydrogenase accessory factor